MDREANERPEFLMPKQSSFVPLVEVTPEDEVHNSEDLALFGITADDKKGTQGGAYDGDLNPMTFNHVKSSGAFGKRRQQPFLSLIEEDDERSYKDDANEFNQWLNSKISDPTASASKKAEDGWPKRLQGNKRLNHALSQ